MTKNEELKFSDLALSPEIFQSIQSIGYEIPSPIQAEAIPHLLAGRDILGVAQTGTGKTAAFALPLLSNIDVKQKKPQILCLAPTRELAIQVAEAFQKYAQFIPGFKVLPIYGGTDYSGQIRQLGRGVHVVVGTPGRVMDHMRKGTLQLDEIKTLVLDEADEMLRMGFIDDVEWILEQMPADHQTALFSATMPAPIKKLTQKYLKNPAEITIKVATTTAPGIRQRYVQIKNNEKLDVLTRIMEVEEFDAVLIFVRTKNATLEVAERLQARGYAASALNGDIAQNQREKIVNNLKNGKLDIVVATDVAARGLDVERISHVINYDVPYDTESYVHRIGRTGRAGRTGDAILFINGRERRMLQAIEKATRKTIDTFEFPSVDSLNERKITQLFARIEDELKKDLKEYTIVVQKYLDSDDIDPIRLAAAFASMEADGQPFFVTKSFVQPSKGRFESDDREERGRGFDRGYDKGTDRNSDRGADRGRSRDKVKGGHRSVENVKTYRIEVGVSHGAEKRDIVGAIANEAGIDSKFMGKIVLNDEYSTIELPDSLSADDLAHLKKVKVRGQNLQIKEAGSSDSKSERKFAGPSSGERKSSDRSYSDRDPRDKKPSARKFDDKKPSGRKSADNNLFSDSPRLSEEILFDEPKKTRSPGRLSSEKLGSEKLSTSKPRADKPSFDNPSFEKPSFKKTSLEKSGTEKPSFLKKSKGKSNADNSIVISDNPKEKASKKVVKKVQTKASIKKGLEKKARRKLERSNAKSKASE